MASPTLVDWGSIFMNQQWEEIFRRWAQSPSQSESDRIQRTERAIREAIFASPALKQRNTKVFVQGSYRNRTNVKRESDIDIGVLCFDTFFFDIPTQTTRQTFGITEATYDYGQFKNEVGAALAARFGATSVSRGTKAFDIKESQSHVEADVAPFFEHRRYQSNGTYLSGVELRPDNGIPQRVINWPEQHYVNGNNKNDRTARRYRALVRVLKNLCNEMDDDGISAAKNVASFLIECLVWNVPDIRFARSTLADDLREILIYLYENTINDSKCGEWGEVSELKYLFRGPKKWTRQQANEFVAAAWQYVGY